MAPSLFAEPRLVVIRGAQEAVKDLAAALTAYCADPVEGVTLLVHHAGGARNKALADAMTKAGATVVACNKITKPAERIDFVRSEIRRAGGTTTPDAVAALVDAVGSDLRELASAASQLVADTGGMVDENAVRRYHRGRAEVTGFTVCRRGDGRRSAGRAGVAALGGRGRGGAGADRRRAGRRGADGRQGVRRPRRELLRAGRRSSACRRGRSTGRGQPARGWSSDGLAAGMAVVAELNAAVKGAAADPEYALEKAVIDLVAARHAALIGELGSRRHTGQRQMPSRLLRPAEHWCGFRRVSVTTDVATGRDQSELTSWASADLRFAAWLGG